MTNPQDEWQPSTSEPLDEDLERRIEEESSLPEPWTNSQIAEQIVCMTEGEAPMDVLGRLIAWDDETWQQCDPDWNARQLTQVDRLEIVQFVAGLLRLGIKFNEGRTKTR